MCRGQIRAASRGPSTPRSMPSVHEQLRVRPRERRLLAERLDDGRVELGRLGLGSSVRDALTPAG